MRKSIKKYLMGGFTPPSYTPTYNSGSDFYNNVMNRDFSNIGSSFTNATNRNLEFQSQMGDMTALSLLANQGFAQGILNIKNVGDSSFSGGTGDDGGSGGKKGMNPKLQQAAGAAGLLLSSAYDAIPTLDKVHNSADLSSLDIRSGVNKALLSGAAGPWGMLAGAVNMGIDKTGGFSDASKGLGKTNDTLNFIASLAAPGLGYFTKKTRDYKVSDVLKLNASAYGGTLDKANTAALNAGAKLAFGASTANAMAGKSQLADTKVQNVVARNEIALAGANNPLISYRNELSQSGGYLQNYTQRGKNGLKLDREFAKKVVKLSKDKVPEFKNGGTVNVIPDGALHKNKHHLENIDEKFEDVTTKGIPVITESKGGDITQHAEVEREEIIFNLDVTKQLEKLMEVGSDEAAIEAGKLLVHEILENTVDNTGLLNKIK